MCIELNLSLEEVELYKESLSYSIIVIGQRLNIHNFKESLEKLKKIDKEIDKIERAMKKGGPLYQIKNLEDSILKTGVYVVGNPGARL